MTLSGSLLLPPDVLLVPVTELHPTLRHGLACEPGDVAITRPRGRARSLLIDRDAASLLERFRQPARISDVVTSYAGEHGLDATQLLREVFPLLRRVRAAGYLVPAGEPRDAGTDFTLSPGAAVGEWTVQRGVHVIDDTEIYAIAGGGRGQAALKIARQPGEGYVSHLLAREAVVLRSLAGNPGPVLLDAGTHNRRSYLALEWLPGDDILATANALRRRMEPAGRHRLLALAVALLDAYIALHARGVIHADVHPMNALVQPDGSVRLVDFGLSRALTSIPGLTEPPRQGVGYFFEPEYARAILAGRAAPAATVAGEIYGLGALIYLILTGNHYHRFTIDRQAFLQQIASGSPVPFTDYGLAPWPEIEAVLARALAKEPAARYSTVRDFAAALRPLVAPSAPAPRARSSADLPQPDDLAAWRIDGSRFVAGHLEAPTASLHYGAAGIAYAGYRIACQRGDAALLADADIWASRATAALGTSEAHWNPSIGITPAVTGPASLHHGPPGVHLVQALVAHARWDVETMNRSLRGFVASCQAETAPFDLVMGAPGLLLGCALALEAIPDDPLLPARPSLITLGNRLADELERRLEALPPVAECRELPVLGMAHGWAGSLYALLRWAEARHRMPPLDAPRRLAELAAIGTDAGDQRRWPRRLGEPPAGPFVASWCNGAAGFVHLYLLAHTLFRDDRWLRVAEAAGRTAAGSTRGASLCCGRAGQAMSLVALARRTGNDRWREQALGLTGDGAPSTEPAQSLFKGAVGRVLVRQELELAAEARMPCFEAEGWPPQL